MKDEEPKDAVRGGVLHDLTHKVPGVPAHDDSRGLSHQGKAFKGKHPSLHKKINRKFNHKGGHGLHDREHERHILPGVQNMIARLFGKD
jgi:hypothetical protein